MPYPHRRNNPLPAIPTPLMLRSGTSALPQGAAAVWKAMMEAFYNPPIGPRPDPKDPSYTVYKEACWVSIKYRTDHDLSIGQFARLCETKKLAIEALEMEMPEGYTPFWLVHALMALDMSVNLANFDIHKAHWKTKIPDE